VDEMDKVKLNLTKIFQITCLSCAFITKLQYSPGK